ncbi:salivary C-type lectin 1-like [Glandiceps talaboti]
MEFDVAGDCDCRIYEFFCEQPTDEFQAEAKAICENLGGSLAIVDNSQTSQVLFDYIDDNCLFDKWCIEQYGFWIGMNDIAVEDEHVWYYDNGVCTEFTNWAAGEPNDNTKRDDKGQDCAQLWYRSRGEGKWGKWDDEYCSYREKGYICEYKIPYCNYDVYWNHRAVPASC